MKRWVVLVPALLAMLSAAAEAQEPGRMLLEGGVVGGNSISCPGHYVGVEGHLRYGVSAYGMVENYQCAAITGRGGPFSETLAHDREDRF